MAPRTPGEGLNVSTVSGPSCRQSCGGRGGPCRMGGVGSKMGHSTVSTPSPRPPPPCCAPPPKVHRRQGVSRMGVDRGAGPQLPALHPVRITQGVPNRRTTLLGGVEEGEGGAARGGICQSGGAPYPACARSPPARPRAQRPDARSECCAERYFLCGPCGTREKGSSAPQASPVPSGGGRFSG